MRKNSLRAATLEELRTFCTAAELGSLGRTAIVLHVTQPALSRRIGHLEERAGVRLLERSARGVKLTPAGRRIFDEARRLLEQADRVQEIIEGLQRTGGPVRLAASHSATEALVADLVGQLEDERGPAVELVIANSSLVRDMVADGRADLGIAASRPNRTPYPGVVEKFLADDAVVCAVPPGHHWAERTQITLAEFLNTPMVMRDPSSNARWTVNAILREHDLVPAEPLLQTGTPQAAMAESRARNAPLLLSRQVLAGHDFHELAVEGLSFPRKFVFVLAAYGEPTVELLSLMKKVRRHADIWCRPPAHSAAAIR